MLITAVPALGSELGVRWVGRRLSVKAEGVALSAVLDEIGRQTGAMIEGAQNLLQPVTVDFRRLTFEESLRRLLGSANYLIVEETANPGSEPTIVRVAVFEAARQPALSDTAASDPTQDPTERITALTDQMAEEGIGEGSAGETIVRMAARAGEAGVRRAAVELLGYLGTPGPRLDLIEGTRSSNNEDRVVALRVLATVDPEEALPALAEALRAGDDGVKGAALEVLATVQGPKALELLAWALRDPDPAIRLATVQLLSQRADDEGIALLRRALSDSNEAVRVLAGDRVNLLEKGG